MLYLERVSHSQFNRLPPSPNPCDRPIPERDLEGSSVYLKLLKSILNLIDGCAGATLGCSVGALAWVDAWCALIAFSNCCLSSGDKLMMVLNGWGCLGPIFISLWIQCSLSDLESLLVDWLSSKKCTRIGIRIPSKWTPDKKGIEINRI